MNKKKLLALLMALVMTFSLVPVTAFAAVTHSSVYVKYVVSPEGAATLGQDFSDYILLGPSGTDRYIPYSKRINLKNGTGITVNAGYEAFDGHKPNGLTTYVCLDQNGENFQSVSTAFTSSAYSDYRQNVDIDNDGTPESVIYLYLLFKESAPAVPTHIISVAAYPSNVTQNAAIFDGTTKSSADLSEGTKLNIGNTTSPYLYAPALNGYSFKGWKLADGEGEPTGDYLVNSYTVGTEDALLLAVYEAEQYTVSFASDDTSKGTVSDGTKKVGTESPYNRLLFSDLNSFANPAEGYQLVGWKNGSETVLDANHTFDVTGDITLTAVFEQIPDPEPEPEPEEPVVVEKHTVTFETAHGSAVEAKTVDAGTTVTRPTNPKRIGYTFSGWYSGDTEFDFDTPITNDLTLTAQWTPEAFFDDSNDEVRIAGQIDLFGADLRSFKDYSGSLTLYRGYEGFSDDTASIKVAKRNYEDGTYVGTDTNELDVANVGVDGLGVEGLNYNALYGVLQSFVKNNIAKNTWVIKSGESSVTYTMTPDTDGAYGYTTVTATPDTSGNAQAVMDAISSSANFTYSRNGGNGSWVAYFPAGSYFSMNDKGQTVGSAGVAAPLKDATGEFSMEEFRTAFFHGGLSTVQTMEDKGSFYLYLKAGFYIDYGANGEERLFLNKDLAVKIDGLVNSDTVLEYINTDHSSGTSLSEIGDLLNFIPQNETITITINYVDPVVVAKIGDAEYTSLQAAVDAAENEDIIELVGSFEQNAIVTIPEGKTVTLDLAGETLTLNASKDRLLVNNGNLTITNGTIAQVNTGSYGVIKNKGTLIIDGITITDAGQATGATVKNDSGTLLIKSNTSITATGTASGNAALYNAAEMTVEDGVTLRNYATDSAVSGYGYGFYCVSIDGGTSTFGTKEGTGVTIEGNRGGIAVNGGAAIINSGSFSGTNYHGLWVTNDYYTTDVTINGGTFIGKTYSVYASVDDGNQDVGDVALTVNNGYFQQILEGNKVSNNDWTIAIKGGYFKTAPAADLLASGFEVVSITNDSDAEAYQAGYRYKVSTIAVAQIGTTQYTTVEAAIAAAAQNGDTVKLLRDASMTGTTELIMDNSITLDLMGHTLAVERINLYKGGLNVTTTEPDGKVTCSSQAFNVYGSETDEANYTTLTIGEGVTVESNYAVCLFPVKDMVSYGATININGTLTGSNGTLFVSGNLGNSVASGAALAGSANIPVINIGDNAVISSSGDQAIAMNGMAVVNVADGAQITGREAIGVKRGILNVNGGTLTATGAKADPAEANNNGTEATGAAISVTSTYNNAGNIQVNVSGGTITSTHNAALYVGHSEKDDNLVTFQKGVTLNVTGGSFNGDGGAVYVADAITDDATMPAKFITGGTFSAKPAAAYVAPGYEAVELTSTNKLESETVGWYKVGEIATTEVTQSTETKASFDASFSASKTVESTDDSGKVLATDKTLSVNIKASNSATAETRAASYDLEKVVEDAIGAANNTNETDLDVTIMVVRDEPGVVENKITYEVHPEATVTSGSETVGTFIVTNDKLADNAVFTIKLPVPPAVAAVGDKVQVTHKRDGMEDEVFQLTVETGGYVTISGITSFSQFELAPITESAYDDNITFGYTLDLQDSININFYMYLSGASDKTIGNYTVQYLYKGGEWQTATPKEIGENSKNYRCVVARCAAKEMTEPVHVRVLHNGVIIKEAEYSVKGYCDYKIKVDTSATQELRNLCQSVLDYGAAAQMKFGYNTDNLATEYNQATFDSIIINDSYNIFNGSLGSNVAGVSGTVNLESKTGVVVYLTPKTGEELKVNSVTVDSENLTYTTSMVNGRLKITVSGVVAYKLDKPVVITVDGGTEIHYSPLAYAYGMQDSNTVGTLCKALFQYWVNAKAYFPA